MTTSQVQQVSVKIFQGLQLALRTMASTGDVDSKRFITQSAILQLRQVVQFPQNNQNLDLIKESLDVLETLQQDQADVIKEMLEQDA